jgi:Universal stress protein family
MDAHEGIEEAGARLVREHTISGAARLHGVTFDGTRVVVASGTSLFRIQPRGGRVVDELMTFPEPGGLAHDGANLWQRRNGRFEQLDERTGLTVRTLGLAVDGVTGIACFEGDLLVLHRDGRSLARVRFEDRPLSVVAATVIDEAATARPLRGLAWLKGELWSSAEGALLRIDPVTARVLQRLPLPGARGISDLAANPGGGLWCVDGESGTARLLAWPGLPGGARASSLSPGPTSATRVSRLPRATHPGAASSLAESRDVVAGAPFARILVPIDFSQASKRALATALVMRERLGAEVHLVHLAEPGANSDFLAGTGASGVSPNELVADARDRLSRFVGDLFPEDAAAVFMHAHASGSVVTGIEDAIREVGATLVVLTRRDRKSLLRSHVEEIARDVSVAVLVV